MCVWQTVATAALSLKEPTSFRLPPDRFTPVAHKLYLAERDYQIEAPSVKVTNTDSPIGKIYSFVTNEMTLPPGLLAYIYKKRWDLEKVFDEMKTLSSHNSRKRDILCLLCAWAVGFLDTPISDF